MKKIIILFSVLLMGIALVGCGEVSDNDDNDDNEFSIKNSNEQVIIDGKTYDLSEDCDEILQELIEDMYIAECPFEEEQPIRKMESMEIYDAEKDIFIYNNQFYQLDKDDEYVETEPEDFDERIVMLLKDVGYNNIQREMKEIHTFTIVGHSLLNTPDFQMTTPNGLGIGSTTKELKNVDAYQSTYSDEWYVIMYLDGELVNYSDYSADAERIQNLDVSEWKQELEDEYKYRNIEKEWINVFCEVEDKEMMMYILAESDVISQINSGEKDTLLVFQYHIEDGKVDNIAITVRKQSEGGKTHYKDFIENK